MPTSTLHTQDFMDRLLGHEINAHTYSYKSLSRGITQRSDWLADHLGCWSRDRQTATASLSAATSRTCADRPRQWARPI